MEHIEYNWTTEDNLPIYAQGWLPAGEVKAVVCLVHGIGEHGGRYVLGAKALTDARYALLSFDLRGHGKSGGARGHTPSKEHLYNDIAHHLEEAEKRYPGKPCFLYGHSLGGNLVINYALRRQPRLAGVVATGPELELAFAPPPVKMTLAYILDVLAPGLAMDSGLDVKGLSHEQKVIDAYVSDPLVHSKITPRLLMSFYKPGKWAIEHAAEWTLPLLLMHGTDDPICSAKASQEFARNAGKNVTLKLWDGMYHEIHNETDQQLVIGYMVSWLDSHC